ncbi:MAG TPA: VOC family protein [Candidatus Baltobacteraceae bacterium]|nr:VOC family protein [Candidatus Baltobacteraceae bacterium]
MNTLHTQAPAGTAITGMDLIGCTVSDVQRSLAFYRDTLGMVPSMASEGGAEFELPDGTTFGIWNPGDGSYPVGCGIMFAVADARAAVALFTSRGATIAETLDSPVCVMGMGSDPDGNGYIIHQRTVKNDPVPQPHVRTATSINGIDWAGYFVSDPKRSIAYYHDVLGMVTTATDPQGRGGEFTLPDGSTFGVWHGDDTPSKGGTLMFAVDDAHAKVAQLRERGVQISDPEDTGGCFMAFTADPDGIPLIIHQKK